MKILKLLNKLNFFKKKEIECDHDEYCPIYLSYLNENKDTKMCKNSNQHYCSKYRLVDKDKWKILSKEERVEIIEKMNLYKFIKK